MPLCRLPLALLMPVARYARIIFPASKWHSATAREPSRQNDAFSDLRRKVPYYCFAIRGASAVCIASGRTMPAEVEIFCDSMSSKKAESLILVMPMGLNITGCVEPPTHTRRAVLSCSLSLMIQDVYFAECLFHFFSATGTMPGILTG